MDDVTRLSRSCVRCGRPLDADAPEGLCPSCVLAAAAEPQPDSLAAEAPTILASTAPDAATGARLAEGQTFGEYRIDRLLGRGGMGEVYAAEHAGTGRRLALKVLRGRLHDRDDRARFLREGQLAASVSHPHTVYIFGSEEIAGMPVIAMELLPGGTLKDRVDAEGPLPVRDAVDAVLDIVGGLDAAQASGILHRDIKPSNCFVDAEGGVKVGDFGLSISTLARDVQIGGDGFQGTPHFAPPEQLRGEPLDVRADIYAVGATLHYLLTGRPPFQASDLRVLFDQVTTAAPAPLRETRPDVPVALAAIVEQCLAKDPRDRPASYATLAESLRTFSEADVRPAPLGPRTVAGLVDFIVISLPAAVLGAWQISADAQTGTQAQIDPVAGVVRFLYFLLIEGAFGASIGKRLFGLRVVGVSGARTWRAILVRSFLFSAGALAISLAAAVVGQEELERYLAAHLAAFVALMLLEPLLLATWFSVARRRNGFAALHDRLSGTRVVVRAARVRRTSRDRGDAPAALVTAAAALPRRLGPFEIIGALGDAAPGRLLAGFDPVLRRRVWIHEVPAGTAAVGPVRRDAGRVTRLHWLTGRRTSDETWDAYEAPDGEPMLARGDDEWSWPVCKPWLNDIVGELEIATHEGSLPALALDRLWARHDGHAVLLDFPAPTRQPATHRATAHPDPAGLLAELAGTIEAKLAGGAARARPVAMPLSAASLLRRWSERHVGSIDAARHDLTVITQAVDTVPRWRRAAPIAIAAVPMFTLMLGGLAVLPQLQSVMTADRIEIFSLLQAVDDDQAQTPLVLNDAGTRVPAEQAADAEDRLAMEIYLAGRYGALIGDEAFWSTAVMQGNLQRLRPTAMRVVRAHPEVSSEELTEAAATLGPTLDRIARRYETEVAPTAPRVRALVIMALAGIGLGVPFTLGLISAAAVRGGLLTRLLGLAVVRRDGREVGRGRSVLRVVIAWLPALILAAWLMPSPITRLLESPFSPLRPAAIAMCVLAAGALWTIARPERGPHDWIAGTWVVPR